MMDWYYGNGGHMSGWGWAAMTIGSVLFLLLLGAIVLLLVRLGSGSGSADRSAGAPSPEQVLADRYARGEIDEEEYRRRLDTLRGRPTPAR